MAIEKKIEIGKRVYTVRELTMQQIADLTGGVAEDASAPLVSLLSAVSDAERADLMPMTPSELSLLVDAVLEVNAAFFAQAVRVGAGDSAAAMENLMRSIYMIAFLP